jgi:hypothetical protein
MKTPLRTALLTLATALALTACGGSSSGGDDVTPGDSTAPSSDTTTAPAGGNEPADPEAAKAEITTVWTNFFHTGTDRADAVKLLENGENLGPALDKAEQEDKETGLVRRAKVTRISFLSPTTANITWTLYNKDTKLLANASGQAVYVDGEWKVSQLTFCTLVELGNDGKPVKSCSP